MDMIISQNGLDLTSSSQTSNFRSLLQISFKDTSKCTAVIINDH